MELRGGSTVRATALPADGLWPATGGTLRLDPVAVTVGRGAAAGRALEVLRLADR